MSASDEIKKALKESGLLIPSNTTEEMLGASQEEEIGGIFNCKIGCRVGCWVGSCDLGHCVFACATSCTISSCDVMATIGGEPSPTNK